MNGRVYSIFKRRQITVTEAEKLLTLLTGRYYGSGCDGIEGQAGA
jgi:hypothetical protein